MGTFNIGTWTTNTMDVTMKPYDAEVKWLESTGTQWIDSGVESTSDVGFRIDCMISNAPIPETYPVVIGSQYSDYSHWISIWSEDYEVRAGTEQSNLSIPFSTRVIVNVNFENSKEVSIVNGSRTPISTHSIPAKIGLFCAGDENGFSTPGASRIYAVQITNGDVLVRDMIPVRFTNEQGQSEGAMYDKVSGQLFKNQGTGKFLVGADAGMPYDYAVEYIETDGVASYIDTGITPVLATYNVSTKFQVLSVANPSQTTMVGNFVFGAAGAAGSLGNRIAIVCQPPNGVFKSQSPSTTSDFPPYDNAIHDVSLSNSGLVFDGVQYAVSQSTAVCGNMCLGTRGNIPASSNPQNSYTQTRFYSFKIYDGDNLVFDGIPVVANGLAGLYDSISRTVKTNAADTGTITAGPRV